MCRDSRLGPAHVWCAATFAALYDNSLNVLTFASKRQEASLLVSQKFSKALSGQIRFAYRRVSVTNVVIPVLLVASVPAR